MNAYHTSKLPGRTVTTTDGRDFLWFSGTDYLGMGHNEDLRRHLHSATETFGNHYGSSRNNSLRLDIYEKAEAQLADFLQTPAAAIVSSGMWAGQLVMKEIRNIVRWDSANTKLYYHYAPGVHPALWANPLEGSKLEWKTWAEETVGQINASSPEVTHIICSDAVGSPMVKAFDFSIFNAIQDPSNTWLIIDESHSLGVLGTNGKGISVQLSEALLPQTIFASSLNKAIGIPAGAIWGAKRVVDTLRKSPWYAGASPPPPAYAYALKALLKDDVYRQQRTRLLNNVSLFTRQIGSSSLFESIAGYPVFCSSNAALFDHLLANGIMASCFPYPSLADAPVTRIAISSLHQKEDLDRLAEVCKRFIA